MTVRWACALSLIALTAACGPEEEVAGKVWYAIDYSPKFGANFTYVQPGSTTGGDQLHMFIGNGSWTLRTGDDFDTGTDFAEWTTSNEADVGLIVDGMVILPDGFVEGDTWDNGTVDAIDEKSVVIGTYEEAITVTVDSGRLAGEAAFVIGTGPIVLTIDGVRWEVSVYEKPG